MNKKTNDNDSCLNCGFIPFCSIEETYPEWSPKNNVVVKQQISLKKKHVLHFRQTAFKSLYVIQSGGLKTFEVDNEGNELIRGFYFAGEILGLEAIASGTYLFTAMALTNTVLCEVPYNHFIELLNCNTRLQKQILCLTSKQLTANFYLNYLTAEQRFACFLIDLFNRLHVNTQCMEFLLPMSRQDIGNYLRLSGESVSRLFTRFKEKKIIAIDHKKIQIIDLDQLKQISALVN